MISADFKQKIHGKKPLKGTFVKMNCPTAVEALGLAGLDFIIIDGEHAPLDEMHLEAMLRAADCVGLPVVVRVPAADEFHILKVLDMGAAGVQIPGLTSTEEVRACLDAALYAPEGHRGLSFAQRSARYGTMDKFEYCLLYTSPSPRGGTVPSQRYRRPVCRANGSEPVLWTSRQPC